MERDSFEAHYAVCIDGVFLGCTLETFMVLLANVTVKKSIKNKLK